MDDGGLEPSRGAEIPRLAVLAVRFENDGPDRQPDRAHDHGMALHGLRECFMRPLAGLLLLAGVASRLRFVPISGGHRLGSRRNRIRNSWCEPSQPPGKMFYSLSRSGSRRPARPAISSAPRLHGVQQGSPVSLRFSLQLGDGGGRIRCSRPYGPPGLKQASSCCRELNSPGFLSFLLRVH